MVSVEWKGKLAFEAFPPSGNRFFMDSRSDFGGEDRGPSPMETLLSAAGACSAMDVLSILEKKRQVVTAYRVEVSGERTPEGTFPRAYSSITLKHYLKGDNLDPVAVARAVQLSDEKYCSVVATLRAAPRVNSEWAIE